MNASLSDRQIAFAGHIRDPLRRPRPADIPERRMAVYRELFFNNFAATLADALPRTHASLSEERWTALVRRFFTDHRCVTPYLHRMPGEFAGWLGTAGPHDPPWLAELADLEWNTQALAHACMPPLPRAEKGDLLERVPVMNPLAHLCAYRHRVHAAEPTADAAGVHLLLWRDRGEAVRLLELNAVSGRLVAMLQGDTGRTGRELLIEIAVELQHPEPTAVITGGAALLADLLGKGILLGVAPS